MTTTWDYSNPYLKQFKVKKEHIDSLGHTNNRVYTDWCEQTAWAHSDALGLGSTHYTQLKRAMAIQEANYHYLLPSFYQDDVVVATWLTSSDNRLRMERSFQISDPSSGQCLFRGTWKLICINLSTNKPARMPKEFINTYLPHVIEQPID